MSDERERVVHPSWCDRDRCTAPEFRPTLDEYRGAKEMGSHVSAPVLDSGFSEELKLSMWQGVTAWDTDTFLMIESGGRPVASIGMGDGRAGQALYALLGQEVKDMVRKWPALYADRYPEVQRALDEESDEATADASMPRDPVELQEQMNAEQEETDRSADWSSRERLHSIAAYEIGDQAAEELLRDVERTAKGCTHPPDEPCFGKARTAPPQPVEPETQDVGEGTT